MQVVVFRELAISGRPNGVYGIAIGKTPDEVVEQIEALCDLHNVEVLPAEKGAAIFRFHQDSNGWVHISDSEFSSALAANMAKKGGWRLLLEQPEQEISLASDKAANVIEFPGGRKDG